MRVGSSTDPEVVKFRPQVLRVLDPLGKPETLVFWSILIASRAHNIGTAPPAPSLTTRDGAGGRPHAAHCPATGTTSSGRIVKIPSVPGPRHHDTVRGRPRGYMWTVHSRICRRLDHRDDTRQLGVAASLLPRTSISANPMVGPPEHLRVPSPACSTTCSLPRFPRTPRLACPAHPRSSSLAILTTMGQRHRLGGDRWAALPASVVLPHLTQDA